MITDKGSEERLREPEQRRKAKQRTMDECGIYNLKELFCHEPKWYEEDPLALDYHNQKILACFGFEETMRNIALQFEELKDYA